MPAFTLHYLFGTDTLHDLNDGRIKRAARNHPCAFSLGLQGPDIFFYYLPMYLKEEKIGTMMHDGGANLFFRNLMTYQEKLADEDERQLVLAYMAGMLGHYSLDTVFHPYVYAYTDFHPGLKQSKSYYAKHFAMESDLDLLYLREQKGISPGEFRQYRTIALGYQEQRRIAKALCYAILRTYQRGFPLPAMMAVIYSMRLGTAALRDHTGLKKWLVQKLEKPFFGCPLVSSLIEGSRVTDPHKLLNRNHESWRNPWDLTVESKKSVAELYQQAKLRYVGILRLLEEYPRSDRPRRQELWSRIGNLSYHSGLDIK